jgi:hypothetical protein
MPRTTSMPGKLRCRLRELLRSESGIAMPTVLSVSMMALGLGGVAAVASISAQQGSVRDYDVKEALAAADAGAERALLRYNRIVTEETPVCLTLGVLSGVLEKVAPPASGWCAPVSGSVGSASYTYQVRPSINLATGKLQLEIVSTGTSDDVSRRLEVEANAVIVKPFSQFSVVSDTDITMDANTDINANTAANGSITLKSEATICGNVQVGPGETVTDSSKDYPCPGNPPQSTGVVVLPLVEQGDVTTNNDNERLVTGEDVLQGAEGCATDDEEPFDPVTRTLCIRSNAVLTLGGQEYSLCRLELDSNSELIIAANPKTRIYFDAPENCPIFDDESDFTDSEGRKVQMLMDSNAQITVTSGDPTSAAFLFVGSDTISTVAHLDSENDLCGQYVVYGPRTDISLNSNTSICGSVAGREIHMDSFSAVHFDDRANEFEVPVPLHFQRTRYVECTGPSGTPPDANC